MSSLHLKYYLLYILFPLSVFASDPVPGTPLWNISADTLRLSFTVESFVEHINSTVDTINSKIDVIEVITESSLDVIDSKINIIDMDLDQLQDTADTTLSKVCVVDSKMDKLQSSVDNVELSSSVLDNVDSKLGALDMFIRVTEDSKLDEIIELDETTLSKVCVVDSKVDALQSTIDAADFDGSVVDQVDSKLCALDQFIRTTEDSKLDEIIDLDETTLSKVCVVDSKVDAIQSTLDAADFDGSVIDQVDSKLCALDMFIRTTEDSKLDEIIELDETTLSKVCVVDSKVDALQSTIDAADFDGSVIDQVDSKLCALDMFIRTTIDSKIDFISETECGTAITQADVGTDGFTIAESGRYCLAEDIQFEPSMSDSNAITISADDVYLDMNGRTLSQTNMVSSTTGISVSTGMTNVIIFDGVVADMSADGVAVASGSSNIIISGVNVYDCGSSGLNISSSADIKIFDSCLEGNGNDGIEVSSSSRMFIFNSLAANNSSDGIAMSSGNNNIIEECVATENGANGISFMQTTTSKIIKCAGLSNTEDGISLEDAVDCEVIACNCLANTVNGIHLDGTTGVKDCYIHDNTLVRNGNINLLEDTGNGPNSILGNYAQNPSTARNYFEGLSGITIVTIQQSTAFTSSPTPWDNINMIP